MREKKLYLVLLTTHAMLRQSGSSQHGRLGDSRNSRVSFLAFPGGKLERLTDGSQLRHEDRDPIAEKRA